MAVTDLTGYTWTANNSIDLTTISFNATFNITFNSGVNSFIGFRFYDHTADEDYNTQLAYEGSDGSNVFDYLSNTWYHDWAKTIQITGGTDATNSTLIAWLESNGTLTPPAPEGYEVTFVTNDGTSVTKLEDVEELPTPLPTTTKSGYTFNGWYYDIGFEVQAFSGDTISSNITLYAKWYANMSDFYQDVADAIRSKNGETNPIKHTDFAYKIKNIQGAKPEETKTVTPDFSSGNVVVTPTSGKVMSQVTINKDSNLIANNIKKDVTVHGITGSSFIAIELTQAQYDALTTKDSNTYYLING